MTKECSCALAIMNLTSRGDQLLNDITDIERGLKSFNPDRISYQELLIGKMIAEDIKEIKEFCNLDISMEEDSLIMARKNITRLNYPAARNLVKNNIGTSMESIRDILFDCKKRRER